MATPEVTVNVAKRPERREESAPIARSAGDARAAGEADRRLRVLLVNAFEKIPGENFRDQRYTFLYESLKRLASVTWLSSDFHHWSRTRRNVKMIPEEDRANIQLVRTLSYSRNVSVRRFVSYLALSIGTFWRLLRLKTRPDVIICMGPTEQMFLVALYGRFRGVPVVIDVIDTWPDLYVQAFPRTLLWFGRLLLAPYFLMSTLTFALSRRVTAVSQTYLDWAMRRGRRHDRDSFAVYYLGARNDQFDASSLPIAPDGVTSCLFAGQFGFSYDIELILEAAEKLQQAGRTDIRFILCGAGDKQAEVARRASALRNVQLHGWVTPEELNRLAANAQVGLCCYTAWSTQSIPTKVFDYLSMGLHVISSLPREARDLLASFDMGSTYRAGDVDDFIACLESAARRSDLGRAGRIRIRSIFDRHFDSRIIYERMIDEVVITLAADHAASVKR